MVVIFIETKIYYALLTYQIIILNIAVVKHKRYHTTDCVCKCNLFITCIYQSLEHINLSTEKNKGLVVYIPEEYYFSFPDYGHKISPAGPCSFCRLRSLGHVVDVVMFEVT